MDADGTQPPPEAAGDRLDDLVRALIANWATVKAALEPADRERLETLVAGIDDLDAKNALSELEYLLTGADLPAQHDVMRLLLGRARFGSRQTESPRAIRAALDRLAGAVRSDPATVASVAGEPVTVATVRLRLAEVPSYGPEDLADPAMPELIRLRVDGRIRLPRFQFRGDRAPDTVVMEVNRLLDAEHDPWGVASWWFDRHAWLRGTPVDLLGGTPEQRLRVAAAAAAEVAD